MDTLDALGFDRLSKTDIFTPVKITQDMVNLLPEEVFHPDFKFLDIACKSGRFLVTLKDRLMESPTMIEIFPDKKDRLNHILNNQLFGLATSEMCLMISTRNLYGSISEFRNIRYIANYTDKVKKHKINIEYLEKEFNRDMKIDVVIGNPPYNNDTYLDFVQFGHSLASQYTIMITPAKWQAKGGEKNEQFRKNIVPYMEKIISTRSGHDIFDIDENAGISYYTIDSLNVHREKDIKNVCVHNKELQSDFEKHDEIVPVLYNRKILQIIGKIGTLGEGFKQSLYVKNTDYGEPTIDRALGEGFKQSLYVKNTDYGEPTIDRALGFKRQTYVHEQDRGEQIHYKDNVVEVMQGESVCGYRLKGDLKTTYNLDKWKCTCSCMMGYSAMFLGKNKIIGSPYINIIGPNQIPKGSFPILKYFNTRSEAESFRSYIHSKLISFLFFLGICGSTVTSEFFRFIPDPINFDHIFTDEELYKKYNLTEKEITIIESVIKERK